MLIQMNVFYIRIIDMLVGFLISPAILLSLKADSHILMQVICFIAIIFTPWL